MSRSHGKFYAVRERSGKGWENEIRKKWPLCKYHEDFHTYKMPQQIYEMGIVFQELQIRKMGSRHFLCIPIKIM